MKTRFDWLIGSSSASVLCLDSEFLATVQHDLNTKGFKLIVVDLAGLFSSQELFVQIVSHIPCDPSYVELHPQDQISVAALEDSLWGGLMIHDDLAVLLCNADNLVDEHINLLLEIYENISYVVAAKRIKLRPGRVKLFLFGEGANFAKKLENNLLYFD